MMAPKSEPFSNFHQIIENPSMRLDFSSNLSAKGAPENNYQLVLASLCVL